MVLAGEDAALACLADFPILAPARYNRMQQEYFISRELAGDEKA
jgi:hypothetical protein